MERQIQPDNLPGYWPARVKSTSHTLSFVSPASCVPRATSGGNLVLASSIYHNSNNMISRPICFHPIEKTSLECGHSAGQGLVISRERWKTRLSIVSRVFTPRLSSSRRKKWQGRFEIKISSYSAPLILWTFPRFEATYVTKERDHDWKIVSKREERRTSLWGYLRNSFHRLLTIDVCSREIGLRNIAKFGFQIVEFCKKSLSRSFLNNNKLFE